MVVLLEAVSQYQFQITANAWTFNMSIIWKHSFLSQFITFCFVTSFSFTLHFNIYTYLSDKRPNPNAPTSTPAKNKVLAWVVRGKSSHTRFIWKIKLFRPKFLPNLRSCIYNKSLFIAFRIISVRADSKQ